MKKLYMFIFIILIAVSVGAALWQQDFGPANSFQTTDTAGTLPRRSLHVSLRAGLRGEEAGAALETLQTEGCF